MSTQTFVTVLVTVKKKTSEVPVECAEHEVPILRFIHGQDMINVVERDYGVLVVPDNAEAELDRLRRKYDGKEGRNVAAVYPSLEHLSAKLGLRLNFDPLDVDVVQVEASLTTDAGAAARKDAAKAAKAAKAKAAESPKRPGAQAVA